MMRNPTPNMNLTPDNINKMLNQWRDKVSSLEGRINTMRTDSQTGLFQEFASVLDGFYQKQVSIETELAKAKETIEKIYNGWPEVKIAMDKEDPNGKKSEAKK